MASKVRVLPSPPTFARRRGERAPVGKPPFACARWQAWRWADGSAGTLTKRDTRVYPPERETAKFGERVGGSNSVVESQPSKLLVAGSIPVSRSSLRPPHSFAAGYGLAGQPQSRRSAQREGGSSRQAVKADPRTRTATKPASPKAPKARRRADVAQLAERVLGKDEVTSSILVIGSNLRSRLPTSA